MQPAPEERVAKGVVRNGQSIIVVLIEPLTVNGHLTSRYKAFVEDTGEVIHENLSWAMMDAATDAWLDGLARGYDMAIEWMSKAVSSVEALSEDKTKSRVATRHDYAFPVPCPLCSDLLPTLAAISTHINNTHLDYTATVIQDSIMVEPRERTQVHGQEIPGTPAEGTDNRSDSGPDEWHLPDFRNHSPESGGSTPDGSA